MTEEEQPKPKNVLRVGKLKATNVSLDKQVVAPDAESAAQAAKALEGMARSDAHHELIADEAEIENLAYETQIVIRQPQDLQPHLDKLEQSVDAAEKAGEITPAQASAAKTELQVVKAEIKKPKPLGERVVGGLKRVSEMFEEVKKSSESIETIGKVAKKVWPYAVIALQAAQSYFGKP